MKRSLLLVVFSLLVGVATPNWKMRKTMHRNPKETTMKHATQCILLAGLLACGQHLFAAEPAETAAKTPPKVTHDWPSYYGPDGTHADLSRVPLLDDLSQAKLLWISEHDDLGHGKTTSGGGSAYGPKSKAAGSCDLIVAGGLVIAGYFNPKNSVVADDVILAVDAATGKTKWKQVYPGKGYNRTARKHVQYGPTPTAADGKVFHLGSGGQVYCVELATGKPLWDSALGDYPEHYKKAVANVPITDEIRKDGPSGALGRPLYTPLRAIGGVLMVAVRNDRLYAFDTATGKELWRLDGAVRTPSPVKIGSTEYALCSGYAGSNKLHLVEPKSGKVLWTESVGAIMNFTALVTAGDRVFIPRSKDPEPGRGEKQKYFLAAYALSETGAKLLWESKENIASTDTDVYACRDGVVYLNVIQNMWEVRILAFKADDGTVLKDFQASKTSSMWGQFHLWGDRLVLIGDHCHDSLGGACTYQSLVLGPTEWKIAGQTLKPRTFKQYVGVVGYMELWTRPAFADGLIFGRAVNKETGQGAIICWDLRANPTSAPTQTAK
jgi:outer membrane protein assembly factor BamB